MKISPIFLSLPSLPLFVSVVGGSLLIFKISGTNTASVLLFFRVNVLSFYFDFESLHILMFVYPKS